MLCVPLKTGSKETADVAHLALIEDWKNPAVLDPTM